MNRSLLVVFLGFLGLLHGCGSKETEAVWGVFNEPISMQELPEPTGAEELSVLWKNNVGSAGPDGYTLLRPAVDAEAVYVASQSGNIRKLKVQTGQLIWQTDLGRPVFAAVGLGEDLVLAGLEDGTVVALRQTDGSLSWEATIGRQIAAIPTAGSARVVVRTADGLVIGLDSTDGNKVWEIQRAVSGFSLHGDSMPLITGDTVVTGLSSGRIIANAIINGRNFWETDISLPKGTSELEQLADIDSNPIQSGASLYVATYQGDVVAIDILDGSVRWRHGFSTRLPMDENDGQLVLVGALGALLVLDADNGEVVWEHQMFRGRGMTNPLALADRIAIGDAAGFLHVLQRTDGSLLQSLRLDNSAITSLARQGESLIAVSVDGTVVAVKLQGS